MRRLMFTLVLLALVSTSAMADLVINEIMYNSDGGPGGADVEFIELYNNGDLSQDLTGWFVLDDDPLHPRCYLVGTLLPGSYLVVAGDINLFTQQYPGVTNYNPNGFDPGGLGFGLGNSGDTVNLHDLTGLLQDTVNYDDGDAWPTSPDGGGPSLELIYPDLDNNNPLSWDPSLADWGTPGSVNSVYFEDVSPICKDGVRDIDFPESGETVNIAVLSYDYEGAVAVTLHVDTGSGFSPFTMYDDGLHGDGAANDSIFGGGIAGQPDGTLISYYAEAVDSYGQSDTWPNNAPGNYRAYTVGYQAPDLRITEILAKNVSGITDEMGEYDDWLEIYNAGTEEVNLGEFMLTDDWEDSRQWQMPALILPADSYVIIWADDQEAQGAMHANFKLSMNGEEVGLFTSEDHGQVMISGFTFGVTGLDISVGYQPANAHFPEYLATPTPAADNGSSELFSTICINEFMTTSLFGGVDDWVELTNRGDSPVDLGGWWLSDDRLENTKWVFPWGTILEPGEFLVIYEDVLGFGFSSAGDDVIMLTGPDTITGMDYYDFGPQVGDVSEGRYHDGMAFWYFFNDPTPGSTNINPVSVPDGDQVTPVSLISLGSYPNPFNPVTEIQFTLREGGDLSLEIFDIKGRRVRQLQDTFVLAGTHTMRWEGLDDQGRQLTSGLYLLRVKSGSTVQSLKLLMVK